MSTPVTTQFNIGDVEGQIAELSDHIGMITYNNVTQLGLTSGSATIAQAYSAMETNSILFANPSMFSSGQCPDTVGYVKIEKLSSARGRIFYYHKTDASNDKQMVLTANNVPTGTWIAL